MLHRLLIFSTSCRTTVASVASPTRPGTGTPVSCQAGVAVRAGPVRAGPSELARPSWPVRAGPSELARPGSPGRRRPVGCLQNRRVGAVVGEVAVQALARVAHRHRLDEQVAAHE